MGNKSELGVAAPGHKTLTLIKCASFNLSFSILWGSP